MIGKDQIVTFLGVVIGLETKDGDYYKGVLKEVGNDSIVLEFLTGKKVIIALSKIEFVKVIE